MKRLFALFLAFIMAFSVLPAAAFAADEALPEKAPTEEAPAEKAPAGETVGSEGTVEEVSPETENGDGGAQSEEMHEIMQPLDGGPFGASRSVSDIDEIKNIWQDYIGCCFYGEGTVSSNLTVPTGKFLEIEGSGSLTVPAGKTLTVNGDIYLVDSAELLVRGKLAVNGNIYVLDSSYLSISGSCTVSSEHYIGLEGQGCMNVSGTLTLNGGLMALWNDASVSIGGNLSAVDNSFIDIHGSTVFEVPGKLTSIDSCIYLYDTAYACFKGTGEIEGGTFGAQGEATAEFTGYFKMEGGALYSDAQAEVSFKEAAFLERDEEWGVSRPNIASFGGCISFLNAPAGIAGYCQYDGGKILGVEKSLITWDFTVNADSDLRAAAQAAAAGEYGAVCGDIYTPVELNAANGDISAPSLQLWMSDEGALTIPQGMSLTIGYSSCSGALNVEGALTMPLGQGLEICETGSLNVSGSLVNNGYIYADGAVSITGTYSGEGDFIRSYVVTDEAELLAALSASSPADPWSVYITTAGVITFTADTVIPNNMTLVCYKESCSITVPAGVTVTNNGKIIVTPPGAFILKGKMVNNGSFSCEQSAGSLSGDVSGDGIFYNYVDVTEPGQLYPALLTDANLIDVLCDITVSRNITVPEGVILAIENGMTMTVKKGYTLTNKGEIWVFGTLNILGSYVCDSREGLQVYEGGTLNPDSLPHVSEAAALTAIEIHGPVKVGTNSTAEYSVSFKPADANPEETVFSLVSGSELAAIDPQTGVLTTGGEGGTVTVRAEAAGGIYTEMTVEIVNACISAAGPAELTAGGKAILSVGFIPENLTGAAVVWSLAQGDEKYASIDAKGELKAASVTERHLITVYADSTDGSVGRGELSVLIVPLPEQVSIYRSEEDITGKTLTVNINAAPTVELSAKVLPYETENDEQTGASQSVVWTSGTPAIAEVDEEGRVTFLKTGTVTITVKSTVNGKSACVKLTAVKDISGFTVPEQKGVYTAEPVLDSAEALVAGTSRTVTVLLEGEPTRTGVVWSIGDEYAAFAALKAGSVKKNADGQYAAIATLTAAAVTGPELVCIRAASENDPEVYTELYVWVIPRAFGVSVFRDGECVNAQTLIVDMNSEAALDLTAAVVPDSAYQGLTWSVPSGAAKYAELSMDDGVLKVIPTGLTGSITLTATAADGSKKNAKVTVKFVRYAQSLSIEAPETLLGGKSVTLKTDISAQAGLTDKKVMWSLSEESLAYAGITTGGKLTARSLAKEVTVSVTATAAGGASDTVEIILLPNVQKSVVVEYNGLAVNDRTLTVDLSQGILELEAITEGFEDETVVWKSGSPKVAYAAPDTGRVELLKTGSVTLTATASDKKTKATVKLKIVACVADVSISTPGELKEVMGGKSLQLTANVGSTVEGVKATNSAVVWSVVSGEELVTLSSSGKLTAKAVTAPGTVLIKAASKEDPAIFDVVEITVLPAANRVVMFFGGTAVGKAAVTVNLGELSELDLSTQVYPFTASQNVTWKSSSNAVATVVDGHVVFNKAGSVTITATTANGKKVSVSFKAVRLMAEGELWVSLDGKTAAYECTVASGKSVTLKALVSETTVSNKKVTWSIVRGGSFAKISSSGKLTAKNVSKDKTVVVRATAADGSGVYADFTVTVKAK